MADDLWPAILLLILPGAGLLGWIGLRLYRWLDANARWVGTDGEVTRVGVEDAFSPELRGLLSLIGVVAVLGSLLDSSPHDLDWSGDDRGHRLDVACAYAVDGRRYDGRRVDLSRRSFSAAEAASLAARFPRGQRVRVFSTRANRSALP
jgi:hypothetical protein